MDDLTNNETAYDSAINKAEQNQQTDETENQPINNVLNSLSGQTDQTIDNPDNVAISQQSKNLLDIIKQNEIMRPSIFDAEKWPESTQIWESSPKIVKTILEEYGTTELSIRELCRKYATNEREFYKLVSVVAEVQQQYALAQKCKSEVWAAETFRIADDTSSDLFDNGKFMAPNNAAVRRSEIRIKQRQYMMGKVNERYADKIAVNERSVQLQVQAQAADIPLDQLNQLDLNSLLPGR